jgi:hypothetical protein
MLLYASLPAASQYLNQPPNPHFSPACRLAELRGWAPETVLHPSLCSTTLGRSVLGYLYTLPLPFALVHELRQRAVMMSKSMISVVDWISNQPIAAACLLVLVAVASFSFQRIFYRLWLHPLSAFPGPKAAAVTTLWKAYVECVLNKSFCHVLEELHAKYGRHSRRPVQNL